MNSPQETEPEFDCAGKAEREGQPKPFVLIASDPLAPWFIDMWAAASEGDMFGLVLAFAGMTDTSVDRYIDTPRSSAKLDSARVMALEMRNWRKTKGLK